MPKVLPLLSILLITMVISGCIATSSSSNDTASNTMNKTKAKITATPKITAAPRIAATATPQIIIIGNENSTVYVEIKGSEFKPSELRIMNGTIVKWKNMDDARYIVNGTNFVSPVLNERDTWNHTFNKTGTFEYNCLLHSWMQHGHIIVE